MEGYSDEDQEGDAYGESPWNEGDITGGRSWDEMSTEELLEAARRWEQGGMIARGAGLALPGLGGIIGTAGGLGAGEVGRRMSNAAVERFGLPPVSLGQDYAQPDIWPGNQSPAQINAQNYATYQRVMADAEEAMAQQRPQGDAIREAAATIMSQSPQQAVQEDQADDYDWGGWDDSITWSSAEEWG